MGSKNNRKPQHRLLRGAYTVEEASDFIDIANSLAMIFINCKKYSEDYRNFPVVELRVNGLVKLYNKSKYYRNHTDIELFVKYNVLDYDPKEIIKLFEQNVLSELSW